MTTEAFTEFSEKAISLERNNEPEVFQNMDKYESDEAARFAMSIRLQFPKFSKGFSVTDFETFVKGNIGVPNLIAIGRLAFPNEWQIQVKSKEIREKLIRLGRTKINTRSCWISPLSQSEIRGYVHWLPNAVGNEVIESVLKPYGEVLFIDVEKQTKWTKVDSDSRYFAMQLTPGKTMDDLPHFFKVKGHPGLITIRGRKPSCFHCREVGHRKTECKKYKDKLSQYCLRKPNTGAPRRRPRGKRHKPESNKTGHQDTPEMQDEKETKSLNEAESSKKKNKSVTTKLPSKQDDKSATVKVTGQPDDKSVTAKTFEVSEETNQLLEKLGILKNLEALRGLSSVVSSAASTWENEIEAVQKKLLSPDAVKIIHEASENPEQASEGKKKKRRKRKKKKSAAVLPEVAQ